MVYKLLITEEMEFLLNECVTYLLQQFKSPRAAAHLLDEVEKIYNQLEHHPYIYRESSDPVLASMHYREAVLSEMNYVLIYKITDDTVYVLGIFHNLENYPVIVQFLFNPTDNEA